MDGPSCTNLSEIMKNPENIRNIALVGQDVYPLIKMLKTAAGSSLSSIPEELSSNDEAKDVRESSVHIKSFAACLRYQYGSQNGTNTKGTFLISLTEILNTDVAAGAESEFTISDGALFVCDSTIVFRSQEALLRQALAAKVRPMLMINNIDHYYTDHQNEGEAIYQSLLNRINSANTVVGTYQQPDMGDLSLNPLTGNVVFAAYTGSGWGFTLPGFARKYATKFKLDENKLLPKLWGDNYYDSERKTWKEEPVSSTGKPLSRGFVKFIIDPIIRLTQTLMTGNKDQFSQALDRLDIQLTPQELELQGKSLLRVVFSKWLNCADCVLDVFVLHCSSPKAAQAYRTERMYSGPKHDPCSQGIANCDPKGPLIVYVSKLVRGHKENELLAFGRVFSGTISPGQEVRVMGPTYKSGRKEDLFLSTVEQIGLLTQNGFEVLEEVPCGNTVFIAGIDKHLTRTGTLSDVEDAHLITIPAYFAAPIIRKIVQPGYPNMLPQFVNGLKMLSKLDPSVQVIVEETGEYVIACNDESVLQVCLGDLNSYVKCDFKASDSYLSYRETVSEKSSETCWSKSPNKLTRLYCTAEPLQEDLCLLIERGDCISQTDPELRTKRLVNEFGWNEEEANQIWTFGPNESGPNMLVNMVKGGLSIPLHATSLEEVQGAMNASFRWVTTEGVLAAENLRKVRINIEDFVMNIHRVPHNKPSGQLLPTARRVYYASELSAKPKLQEPVFLVEMVLPADVGSTVYSYLNDRRGVIVDEDLINGTNCKFINAYLPVAESFGLSEYLTKATEGRASMHCVLDHWSDVDGDPLDPSTKAGELVRQIRVRKGMPTDVPKLEKFIGD